MRRFNKSLLAASLFVGFGANAANVIDLSDNDTTDAVIMASEQTISSSGTNISNAVFGAGTDDFEFAIGDNISDGATITRYFRVDLDNGATFDGTPSSVDLSGAVADTNVAIISGGNDLGFVIIGLTVDVSNNGGGNNIVSTNTIEIDLGAGLTVTSQSTVTLTVAAYATFADASSQNNALSVGGDSEAILKWEAATSATQTTTTSLNIDVGSNSKQFIDGITKRDMTAIGKVDIAVDTTHETANGTDSSLDLFYDEAAGTAASVATVTGDLTFTQDLTNGAADGTYNSDLTHGVFLDNNNNCVDGGGTRFTTATDGGSATLNFDSGVFADTLCVVTNAVSPITGASYSLSFAYAMETGYTNQATSSFTLNTLAKNGSTASQNMLLTPGSTFGNASFYRIANTSSIAGDVSVQLWNDSGSTVTFNLSAIEGISSDSIGANSATDLIGLSAIYAAAQAEDSTFDAGTGKLRMSVTGEFSTIDLDAVVLSTDSTSFSIFNN